MPLTKYSDIKPDTSLYSDPIEKGMARAKCAIAQEAGKAIQIGTGCGSWDAPAGIRFAFSDVGSEYRVLPEPVVTTETEWVLYVPMCGPGRAFNDPANRVNAYLSRSSAVEAARYCCGFVLIDQEEVTYTDGVETKRKSIR